MVFSSLQQAFDIFSNYQVAMENKISTMKIAYLCLAVFLILFCNVQGWGIDLLRGILEFDTITRELSFRVHPQRLGDDEKVIVMDLRRNNPDSDLNQEKLDNLVLLFKAETV